MPKLTKFERIFMKFATLLQNLWITENFVRFPAILIKFREILSENHRFFLQISAKVCKHLEILLIFSKFCKKKSECFKFEAVQRSVNLVDLEKCCKMSIRLQKSALIQPRTSRLKFAEMVVGSTTYSLPCNNFILNLWMNYFARDGLRRKEKRR